MKLKPTFHKNLWRELRNHKIAYLVLVLFLTAVVSSYAWAGYNPIWQRASIVALGIGYFLWGVFTHLSSRHLTVRLVFEYAAISILASVSLITLTV